MKQIYVLVKSWGEERNYYVKVLGASENPEKLREIIYKDVEPLMREINESAKRMYDKDPDMWDGEPFTPYSADVCFLDDEKMNWFDDTNGVPTDYEIIATDVL